MKKTKWISVLLVAAVLLTAGCGQQPKEQQPVQTPEAASGEPTSGGKLVVAISNSPSCLDGDSVTTQDVNDIMNHVYEGLFEFNANYEPVPQLAESYTLTNEDRTYDIKLRQGVKFHNGDEMNAGDVIASLDRWLTRNGNGQEVAKYVESYEAINDYEVTITFKEPYAPFLSTISANVANQKLYIRPKELVEKYADSIMTEQIGTGPYEYVDFVPDQYVRLKRFADYTPNPAESSGLSGMRIAYADELEFAVVPEQAVRIAGIQSGQYQFAIDIPSDQYRVLAEDERVQNFITSPNYQLYLILNQGSKALQDIKARQAILVGLDMEQLGALGIGDSNFWHLNACLFPPGSQWYDEQAGKDLYNSKDIEKAKELLAQSSYDGSPIVILDQKDNPVYQQTATALQTQLEAIGFTVDLQLLDNATVVDKRSQKDAWDIHVNSFKAPDPDPQVYGAWMGTNKWIGNWDDSYSREMDEIFERMLTTVDQAERYKIVQEWYAKFYETVPYVKIVDYDGLYIASQTLKDYSNFTTPYFWNVWLEQ